MGIPIKFSGAKSSLSGNGADVGDLPAHTNGRCVTSCWQFSEEELSEIKSSGMVWVTVLSGQTAPPIFVGSENEVRKVVFDYGDVWKRGKQNAR